MFLSKKSLIKYIPNRFREKTIYLLVLVWLLIKHLLDFITGLFKKIPSNFRLSNRLVYSLVAITIIGLIISSQVNQVPQSDIVTYSTDNPSEINPDASFKWTGKESDPKRIALPAINAEGYIQKVGKDQNNQIAVPNNIHMAGWFVDTVNPGDMGLSIIDGHVDGRSSLGGVFKDLSRLTSNDKFTIEFGNGSIKEFEVVSVRTMQNSQAGDILFSQDFNISNQLNLITCAGSYDRNSREYDMRVIVVSRLVN